MNYRYVTPCNAGNKRNYKLETRNRLLMKLLYSCHQPIAVATLHSLVRLELQISNTNRLYACHPIPQPYCISQTTKHHTRHCCNPLVETMVAVVDAEERVNEVHIEGLVS
jgi:hypothetical protein